MFHCIKSKEGSTSLRFDGDFENRFLGRLEQLRNETGEGKCRLPRFPKVLQGYFPPWKLKTAGVIMPEERPPQGQAILSGEYC